MTVKHPPVALEGGEAAMLGPDSFTLVNPDDGQTERKIWVRKFSAKLIDDTNGQNAPEFICHAHVTESGAGHQNSHYLGAQSGSAVMTLADGIAVTLTTSPVRPLLFYGMAADIPEQGKPRRFHYESEIEYYEESDARALGLKELQLQFVFGKVKNSGKDLRKLLDHSAHKGHFSKETVDHYNEGYWTVPRRSRHEYRNPLNEQVPDLKKSDIRIYHIHTHLHAYAEYAQIYDATEKRVVFQSNAETYSDRPVLKKIEHYSSDKGFVLKKGHQYELVSAYNNTTNKDIGAMLTMRMMYTLEN